MGTIIGTRLQNGKYTLDQELGRGGFGVTYKATLHALAQTVVVKTLDELLRHDPNFAQSQRQFQDEAKRLARCTHPNIVRVLDFFVEADMPFIVMEYVPGPTLDTVVLPNQPLSEATALHYIRQLAAAVNVVHHNGLLHRDIKPQNVILRQGTDQVVLIDFGIAREFSPGRMQTHTSIVSPGYAPIEQYVPQEQRSPATDVYGLAATLYTLLTAQVPVASILRERQPFAAPRDLRPDLSAAVNQAILWGMAVEPRDRPASVDAWLKRLPQAATAPALATAGTTSRVATMVVSPPHRSAAEVPQAHSTAPPGRQPSVARPADPRWPLIGLGLVATMATVAIAAALYKPTPASNSPVAPAVETEQQAPNPAPAASPEPPTAEPAPVPSPSPSPSVAPSPETQSDSSTSGTAPDSASSDPTAVPSTEPSVQPSPSGANPSTTPEPLPPDPANSPVTDPAAGMEPPPPALDRAPEPEGGRAKANDAEPSSAKQEALERKVEKQLNKQLDKVEKRRHKNSEP